MKNKKDFITSVKSVIVDIPSILNMLNNMQVEIEIK